MPEVSALIAVYNGEATISHAIDSVLNQRFDGDFEVIVVNDGSTDATAETLAGYGDRIRVITQENCGRAEARNAGVRAARGEYVAFLDADDEWLPGKLSAMVPVLRKDRGCVLAYSNVVLADANGNTVSDSGVPDECRRPPSMNDLLRQVFWCTYLGAIVARRSAILECGSFAPDFGKGWGYEDTYLWIRMRERGEFRYVDRPLMRYRIAPIEQAVRKRAGNYRGDDLRSPKEIVAQFLATDFVFVKLLRERYGDKADAALPWMRRFQARDLTSLAMIAMHDGDAALARAAYSASLLRNPRQARTAARLAWAFFPAIARNAVRRALPAVSIFLEKLPFDPFALDGARVEQ